MIVDRVRARGNPARLYRQVEVEDAARGVRSGDRHRRGGMGASVRGLAITAHLLCPAAAAAPGKHRRSPVQRRRRPSHRPSPALSSLRQTLPRPLSWPRWCWSLAGVQKARR